MISPDGTCSVADRIRDFPGFGVPLHPGSTFPVTE